MDINQKRKNISEHVFERINKNYKDKKIVFYECPTGSGKTAIILKAAYDLMVKYNISVIISTSSNSLALNFFKEGVKDIKKYYNIDIDKNNEMELLFGKSNFIDIETLEFAVKSDFDNELSRLDWNEVLKWYENKENQKLTEKFLRDFNIGKENAKYISFNSESNTDEIATIKNFPNFFKEENKIYVTNHLYLITLIEVLSKIPKYKYFAKNLKNIPIFVDEAHQLNKLATLKYTSTFSTFRLKNLFQELTKKKKLHKQNRILKEDILKLFKSTIHNTSTNLPAGNPVYERHFKELSDFKDQYDKKFDKIIDDIIPSNKTLDKKKEKILKRFLKKEFFELKSIFYSPKKERINFSYSVKRGYLKAEAIKRDAKFELRKYFWQKTGNVTLFSGSYRVYPEHLTPYENRWTLSRTGLFKFSSPQTVEQEQLNLKINYDVNFKVFKWLFPKKNLKYTIIEDDCLQPVRSKDKMENRILKEEWVQNIVTFYNYYKNQKIFKDINLLILTGSYEEVSILKEKFEDITESKNIFYEKEEENSEALLEKYRKKALISKGNILIGTLTFYTGINLYGELCDVIFMTKLPYSPFNGLVIKNKKDSAGNLERQNYENEMVLTFRQGVGRASRNENDKVVLFLFDKRINKPKKKRLKGFLEEMGIEFNFQEEIVSKFGDYKEKILKEEI